MLFKSSELIFWIIDAVLLVWVSGITYLLLRALANYNRLTKGASERTLSDILNNLLQQGELTQTELKKTQTEIRKLREEGKAHLQKVGLVRFNPFSDTGGDQSFTLALLDGEDHGVIVTSLYARTGVRWYVKTIRKGKGVEHELSKEEQEALKKALREK